MTNFIVYFFLFFFTVFFARQYAYAKGNNMRTKEIQAIIFLLVTFTLIVGLRWDVGRDYMAYYDLLKGDAKSWSFDRLEPLSKWSIFIIQNNKWPYYIWFMLMAFLQLFFVSKAIISINKKLLPIGLICFLAFCLSFDMNVIRQGTALSIMLYAYTFIAEKRLLHFSLFVILAFLFHRTSIVFAPFFLFYRIDKIPSLYVQIPLFLLLTFWGSFLVDYLISLTGSYWDLLRYGQKIDQLAEHEWEIKSGMGIGVFFTNVRRFLMIIFSVKMMELYKDKMFVVFYMLFFVGACMYTATMNDMLLERMYRYFSITDVVISAYFFHYLLNYNRKNKFIAYVLISGIIVIASYEVIAGPDWHFVPNLL